MNVQSVKSFESRGLAVLGTVFALVAVGLLAPGRHDYPDLHTVLDTGMCLLSGVLAFVLWDMGTRIDRVLPRAVAVSFGATALLELIHVLVTIEWSGALAPITQAESILRPATWPLAAHVLPIGILGALWAMRRGTQRVRGLTAIVFALGPLLFPVFYVAPRYTPAAWLGITRPTLILVPLLWAAIVVLSWRLRATDRLLPALARSAGVLVLAHGAMLYSQAPHDPQAMVAHLGKICGYLLLLMSVMQMASSDMQEFIRADRELSQVNETLERRVGERTAQLAALNETLEASEERFRTLAESLPHLVWTCRPDGYCDYLSRQWVEYTGQPAEQQIGYGWAEHLHPDDRDRVQAEWTEATKRGDLFDVEFRIRRGADSAYRWFKTRAVPLRAPSGQIIKWFGSNTDCEDFKRFEQKLQTQLARLNLLHQITRATGERQDLRSIFQVVVRSIEEHLPVDFGCICLYDPLVERLTVTCVGVRSGPLAEELALTEQSRIGIDQNGLSRCVRGQLVYEDDIREAKFPFPERLARGGLRALVVSPLLVESKVFGVVVAARREAGSFSSGECEFLRQLSEHVALAAHQAQLYGALQVAYDDLRQTQQAVMQQERLRALGQMASGIAHDINNAISPAALYVESILEQEQALGARTRSQLEIVQRALEDVAQTVARMREFYRQRETQLVLAPVDVNLLLQQVVDLTRARWHDMPQQRGIVIALATEFGSSLPAVMGVESEIREALINLVFNAVDAMPAGGTLTLRTRLAGEPEERQVRIEVTDTGVGMDADTRRRCLEPFFTTKGERGTGLGLAMVYGMVQRHSADIEIDSAEGRGTTVRLSFAVPAAIPASAAAAPGARPEQRLRLLLIDDDPLLIKSLRDTLEGDGHVIVSASDGQSGIDTFRAALARKETFAAVITDLGMPYVDGRKVAAEIKSLSPGTPVIMLTGWGQRLVAEDDTPPHVDRVLAKPPKLRELRQALAQCCTRSPA